MNSSIEKVITDLKEKEESCINYYLPSEIFCDDVVESLGQFSTNKYNIFDIFSTETIEKHILDNGLVYLQADAIGGNVKSVISTNPGGAREIDHSAKIPRYVRVFGDWLEKKWISIEFHPDKPTIPVKIVIR